MAEKTCKVLVRDMRQVMRGGADHDIEVWSDVLLSHDSRQTYLLRKVGCIDGVVLDDYIGGPFLKIWVDPRYPFNEVFKEVEAAVSREETDADSG